MVLFPDFHPIDRQIVIELPSLLVNQIPAIDINPPISDFEPRNCLPFFRISARIRPVFCQVDIELENADLKEL